MEVLTSTGLVPRVEESEANVLGNVRSSEDTAVTPGVAVNMYPLAGLFLGTRWLAALLLSGVFYP